jgi:hypothetical protein
MSYEYRPTPEYIFLSDTEPTIIQIFVYQHSGLATAQTGETVPSVHSFTTVW